MIQYNLCKICPSSNCLAIVTSKYQKKAMKKLTKIKEHETFYQNFTRKKNHVTVFTEQEVL
jgi:hypothetical protein